MTTPTRAEMRADLARAMGWIRHNDICWENPHTKRCRTSPPDFFTDAEANRKLLEWLAGQSVAIQEHYQRELISALSKDTGDKSRWGLVESLVFQTAPLDVKAEAAWLAIQEEQ